MDRNTRTMMTEVDIPNKDLHLVPGMYANTTFPLQKSLNTRCRFRIDAIVARGQSVRAGGERSEPRGEAVGGAGHPGTRTGMKL